MVSKLLALEVYRFSFSYLLQYEQSMETEKNEKKDVEVIVGLSVLGPKSSKNGFYALSV